MLCPLTPNENKFDIKWETEASSNNGNNYIINFYTETNKLSYN